MSAVQESEVMVKTEWRQLNADQIRDFQRIVRTLNIYHSSIKVSKSEGMNFRERLVQTQVEDIKSIAIKHFGDYEYFVSVKITEEDKEQWIHIDGIAEERKLFKGKDRNHPVFSMVCLEDIYSNAESINEYSF
jgi:hypothetical protein